MKNTHDSGITDDIHTLSQLLWNTFWPSFGSNTFQMQTEQNVPMMKEHSALVNIYKYILVCIFDWDQYSTANLLYFSYGFWCLWWTWSRLRSSSQPSIFPGPGFDEENQEHFHNWSISVWIRLCSQTLVSACCSQVERADWNEWREICDMCHDSIADTWEFQNDL